MIARRSIIKGLVALVAAPAIIKVVDLMPVNARLQPGNTYLTINEITREAVQLFKQRNEFLRNLPPYEPSDGAQLDVLYGTMSIKPGLLLGDTVVWDADYLLPEGSQWRVTAVQPAIECELVQPVPSSLSALALAAAVVAAAPALLEKTVTRRFWAK